MSKDCQAMTVSARSQNWKTQALRTRVENLKILLSPDIKAKIVEEKLDTTHSFI